MLLAISALKGFSLEANDGNIGSVSDVLFDDQTWIIRWLVVDTGTWLSKRKVLVHPSSVNKIDFERETIRFDLTKKQIESSPDIANDEPVSMQMEDHVYDYYNWDPYWGGSYFGLASIGQPLGTIGYAREASGHRRASGIPDDAGDPHLRSSSAVSGYHIRATDGEIGHVENFLFNDETWDIRYLIVDTKNWWPGKHVLLSPYCVMDFVSNDEVIDVAVTRQLVKDSPPWDPAELINQAYEEGLHRHYGWAGYGFPGSFLR